MSDDNTAHNESSLGSSRVGYKETNRRTRAQKQIVNILLRELRVFSLPPSLPPSLQSGKVHFGYIYGVGLLGCTSMYIVLNLMSVISVSVGCVVSVLGYCLLPMVFLSCFSLIVSLQ